MLKKDQAVCIRTSDYSETSQIVTLFMRTNGKINAIAKGSRRPKSAFGSALEIFSFGQVVFSDSKSGLSTLTEFDQQPIFPALRSKLFALNCCFFAVELLNCFTEQADPHPELFDNFIRFLKDTQDSQDRRQGLSFLIVFQLSLLGEIGSAPVFNACTNCSSIFNKTWKHIYFSSSENGLICRDCEPGFIDKISLSAPAAACFVNLKLIAEADEKTLDEIEKVLIYHFTQLLGRGPKMAKYIIK